MELATLPTFTRIERKTLQEIVDFINIYSGEGTKQIEPYKTAMNTALEHSRKIGAELAKLGCAGQETAIGTVWQRAALEEVLKNHEGELEVHKLVGEAIQAPLKVIFNLLQAIGRIKLNAGIMASGIRTGKNGREIDFVGLETKDGAKFELRYPNQELNKGTLKEANISAQINLTSKKNLYFNKYASYAERNKTYEASDPTIALSNPYGRHTGSRMETFSVTGPQAEAEQGSTALNLELGLDASDVKAKGLPLVARLYSNKTEIRDVRASWNPKATYPRRYDTQIGYPLQEDLKVNSDWKKQGLSWLKQTGYHRVDELLAGTDNI